MTFIMTARFNSLCSGTGDPIKVGDSITRTGRGYAHQRCLANTRDNSEYAQGIADGQRYSMERKVYGQELAEQFAMADEMARYNRGDDD